MKKELGISVLLVVLCAYCGLENPRFLSAVNLENTAALVGIYGIFSVGLGLIIITGGIDLSVGSLFALQGVVFGLMLGNAAWPLNGDPVTDLPWWLAALLLMLGTMFLGLVHGLLVTRAKMQPFIVTLCGLLIYRGAARYLSGDRSIGYGEESYGFLRWLQNGKLPAVPIPLIVLVIFLLLAGVAVRWWLRWKADRRKLQLSEITAWGLFGLLGIVTALLLVLSLTMNPLDRIPRDAGPATIIRLLATQRFAAPMPFVLLILVAIGAAVLLHGSVYGRYLYAVGRNEEATRFSGINTRRVITSVYVLSAALVALSGMLLAFYSNAITPASHGSFYELFGIAAAVLGGCSLRGGEGSILGIVLGAILIQVLQNLVNLLGLPSSLNFAVMGVVILLGVLADQLLSGRGKGGWKFGWLRLGPSPETTDTPPDTVTSVTVDTSADAGK